MSFLAFGFLLILTGALMVAIHLIRRDIRLHGAFKSSDLFSLIPFSLFYGVLGAAPFLVVYYILLKVV